MITKELSRMLKDNFPLISKLIENEEGEMLTVKEIVIDDTGFSPSDPDSNARSIINTIMATEAEMAEGLDDRSKRILHHRMCDVIHAIDFKDFNNGNGFELLPIQYAYDFTVNCNTRSLVVAVYTQDAIKNNRVSSRIKYKSDFELAFVSTIMEGYQLDKEGKVIRNWGKIGSVEEETDILLNQVLGFGDNISKYRMFNFFMANPEYVRKAVPEGKHAVVFRYDDPLVFFVNRKYTTNVDASRSLHEFILDFDEGYIDKVDSINLRNEDGRAIMRALGALTRAIVEGQDIVLHTFSYEGTKRDVNDTTVLIVSSDLPDEDIAKIFDGVTICSDGHMNHTVERGTEKFNYKTFKNADEFVEFAKETYKKD